MAANSKHQSNNKHSKGKKGKKIFEFKLNLTPKNFFLWSIVLLIIFFIFFSARDISNLFPEKSLTALIGDIKNDKVEKVEVVGDKILSTYEDGKVYSTIKKDENLKDFNGDLAVKIFKGLYEKEYSGIWVGVSEGGLNPIIQGTGNDFFSRISLTGLDSDFINIKLSPEKVIQGVFVK